MPYEQNYVSFSEDVKKYQRLITTINKLPCTHIHTIKSSILSTQSDNRKN